MNNILQKMKKNSPGPLTMHEWLGLSAMFSIFLLFCRIVMTGEISYAFLAWNLFLAWIPYFISRLLSHRFSVLRSKIKFASLIFLWLMFMPNTFYIITDLFHLDLVTGKHQWFDLTMILSFAWTGILFGIISIRRMEMILVSAKGKLFASIVICAVMWLNAFGVYIGRYLRFNSWEIITNPFQLLNEIFAILLDPYSYRWVWAMTFCFSIFMLIIYYTIKKLSETFD